MTKMKKIVSVVMIAALAVTSVFAKSAKPKKILAVASSEHTLTLLDGTTTMETGFYLNEFAVPAMYAAERGYEIVLATPEGNRPVIDAGSNSARFFGGDEAKRAVAEQFVSELSVISLKYVLSGGLDQYAGILIPGGHAPLIDLVDNAELGEILTYFHTANKPTAFICHGPAAILSSVPNAAEFKKAIVARDFRTAQQIAGKDWIYYGYKMTGFTSAEEKGGEVRKGTEMPVHITDAMQIAGGIVELGHMSESHVVRDRELITAQNPASDQALAEAFYRALQGKK